VAMSILHRSNTQALMLITLSVSLIRSEIFIGISLPENTRGSEASIIQRSVDLVTGKLCLGRTYFYGDER